MPERFVKVVVVTNSGMGETPLVSSNSTVTCSVGSLVLAEFVSFNINSPFLNTN